MPGSILLVDDELHVAQILSRRLAREGYEIKTARDGVEALGMINEFTPDLVISDLQMPRMDGISLALKLSEDPALREVPIILLTARGHRVNNDDIEQSGIVRLMAKPFSSQEMVSVVGEVLGRSGQEAA